MTFETERLHIRAWRRTDAEEAFVMYGDPRVAEYLTGVPEESVDSQRTVLDRIIKAYDFLDIGMGSFPLIERASGALVGCILLKPLPRSDDLEAWVQFRDEFGSGGTPVAPAIHEIEVGWHLAHAHWGKGFATEAAQTLLSHGFDSLGLQEVYAVLYPANKASARVAGRIGMKHQGSTDRFYGRELDYYKVTPLDLGR